MADHAASPEFFRLLDYSYQRFVGAPLAPEGSGPAWLYQHAPFAVVAGSGSRTALCGS
ncbi:MAG: hypothetical protein JO042_07120 [Sinobacteraceae bacterium]|nr:hypothetical protein [Nevskiaceae bacterium]